MVKSITTVIGVVCLTAGAASGQQVPESAIAFAPLAQTAEPIATQSGAAVGWIAIRPVDAGHPVLNAPYSADAVTEITQMLADGNRIEQRSSATVARDGRGRTRREQQGVALGSFLARSEMPLIAIVDPSAGTHVTLDNEQRVAFRTKAFAFLRHGTGDLRVGSVFVGRRRLHGEAPGRPDATALPVTPPAMFESRWLRLVSSSGSCGSEQRPPRCIPKRLTLARSRAFRCRDPNDHDDPGRRHGQHPADGSGQ